MKEKQFRREWVKGYWKNVPVTPKFLVSDSKIDIEEFKIRWYHHLSISFVKMNISRVIKSIGDACFIGLMIIGVFVGNWFIAILGFMGFIAEGIAYALEVGDAP